jgi:hypothetical protein
MFGILLRICYYEKKKKSKPCEIETKKKKIFIKIEIIMIIWYVTKNEKIIHRLGNFITFIKKY